MRVLWRYCHVTSRLWLLVLLWTVVGGMFLSLFIVLWFIAYYFISIKVYGDDNESKIDKTQEEIEYYQRELKKQFNTLECLETKMLLAKKTRLGNPTSVLTICVRLLLKSKKNSRDTVESMIDEFVDGVIKPKKEKFTIVQYILKQTNEHNKISKLVASTNKNSNNIRDIVCNMLTKMVGFLMFHLIGVRWTLDSFTDRPINHILHRFCEDITSLIVILLFATVKFNCDANIDLCANYDIRNIYHNSYVLVYIVIVGLTVFLSPLFFYLNKDNVVTIKQECQKLVIIDSDKDDVLNHLYDLFVASSDHGVDNDSMHIFDDGDDEQLQLGGILGIHTKQDNIAIETGDQAIVAIRDFENSSNTNIKNEFEYGDANEINTNDKFEDLPNVHSIAGGIGSYFTIGNQISSSEGVRVLEGYNISNDSFAIKEIARNSESASILFRQEVMALSKLKYPNIVELSEYPKHFFV